MGVVKVGNSVLSSRPLRCDRFGGSGSEIRDQEEGDETTHDLAESGPVSVVQMSTVA